MHNLTTAELKQISGGVAPVIVGAYYAVRGAAALYALFEAGRYAGSHAYE
jgi:lactobin A/cerein 7B family class IIb bacteriocin